MAYPVLSKVKQTLSYHQIYHHQPGRRAKDAVPEGQDSFRDKASGRQLYMNTEGDRIYEDSLGMEKVLFDRRI